MGKLLKLEYVFPFLFYSPFSSPSNRHFHPDKHTETTRRLTPDSAAIYTLLGHLFRRNKDVVHANDAYVSALRLNPFMWDAFTGLCHSGESHSIPVAPSHTPADQKANKTQAFP